MAQSRLELVLRTRPAQDGVPRRDYLDFVIDGVSLQDRLGVGHLAGSLGWSSSSADAEHRQRLALRAPPETATGRVALCVCPACCGLDCGAVTARITRDGDDIVWSEFCFEDQPGVATENFPGIGPFRFDRAAYRRTIQHLPTYE